MTVIVETKTAIYQRTHVRRVDKNDPDYWIIIYEDETTYKEPKEYKIYIDGRLIKR